MSSVFVYGFFQDGQYLDGGGAVVIGSRETWESEGHVSDHYTEEQAALLDEVGLLGCDYVESVFEAFDDVRDQLEEHPAFEWDEAFERFVREHQG